MGLAELCVRRPVLATVLNLLVMLAGVMAFERLTVREYPNIDMPVVTVQTDYRGASAAIVESTVTKTLEDSLSGIEGIDFMTSTSRAESSQISLTFDPSRDIDSAANDVRDRVARVRQRLPEDVDEPRIAKAEADAQPILWLALSSSQHSPLQISQVADVQIKDRLQSIPGIADIRINGERITFGCKELQDTVNRRLQRSQVIGRGRVNPIRAIIGDGGAVAQIRHTRG